MLLLGCLKRIKALCSRFFCFGNIEIRKRAKVAWSGICLPKTEGGMGLTRLSTWNKTLCLRLVWLLFAGNDSIRATWHKQHHIMNKSFWEIEETTSDPWTWKTLLHLRPLAIRFLRSRVGNGQSTYFWHDHWTPLGPLINQIGPTGLRSLCIPSSAKVANVCDEKGWRLPAPRSDSALNMHLHLTTIPLPRQTSPPDTYHWNIEDVDCSWFSSSKTWEVLRPRQAVQAWNDLVWFKGAVPKYAFNMWVSQLNRLPTRQRLASWGITTNGSCCLCSRHIETRDHLLITCDYASEIWSLVFSRLCPTQQLSCCWSELLSWIRQSTSISPSLTRKVVAQTSVFHLWKQRNNVAHNRQSISPQIIFQNIDREVRNTINGRRHKMHWRNLISTWFGNQHPSLTQMYYNIVFIFFCQGYFLLGNLM